MGASKRYKNKTCSYCGLANSSSTNDHVIARPFFLDDDRTDNLHLPQVPSCTKCNNGKSILENYIASSLLIGSMHPDADRYRRDKIAARLRNNLKLRRELKIDSAPEWVNFNGIWQQMHAIKVNPSMITQLIELIVRGLYVFHYGEVLPQEFAPDATMFRPEVEVEMWAKVSELFPPEAVIIKRDLGRGTFTYTCVQSPMLKGLTAWVIAFHGRIRLHGADGSSDHWWCITRPTEEYVSSLRSE